MTLEKKYILNPNIEIAIYGYNCRLCNIPFNSFASMRSHLRKVHQQKIRIYRTYLKPWRDPNSLFCSSKLGEISKKIIKIKKL